jgi:hypothetical protein
MAAAGPNRPDVTATGAKSTAGGASSGLGHAAHVAPPLSRGGAPHRAVDQRGRGRRAWARAGKSARVSGAACQCVGSTAGWSGGGAAGRPEPRRVRERRKKIQRV